LVVRGEGELRLECEREKKDAVKCVEEELPLADRAQEEVEGVCDDVCGRKEEETDTGGLKNAQTNRERERRRGGEEVNERGKEKRKRVQMPPRSTKKVTALFVPDARDPASMFCVCCHVFAASFCCFILLLYVAFSCCCC